MIAPDAGQTPGAPPSYCFVSKYRAQLSSPGSQPSDNPAININVRIPIPRIRLATPVDRRSMMHFVNI